ncbi:MAG: PRK06851 family protein [Bacillota bacterium]
MSGKVRHYYAGGNTARGFHSLYASNLQGLQRLFILKGGPGTGKSSLMKAVGKHWNKEGWDIEYLHCASDNESIDGVIIPGLKAGIVDGTAPHVIEPELPGVVEEYINLGAAWDSHILRTHREEIAALTTEIAAAFQAAYDTYAQALKIHDDWEKIYIDNMSFESCDALTAELMEKLFSHTYLNKQAEVKHRFLGAATPEGPRDFIGNLTEELPKRYFIKGRPGTGKSTMLKKLAQAAEDRGLDVEIYHCGFDPNSLDMVIVRELGFAIFDSTAPHEYFPERAGDEIVDVYERAVNPGTDEKYADEIETISKKYRNAMKEATSYLAKAKALHDELEGYYISAMDFNVVEELKNEIQVELNRLASQE